MCIRRDIGSHAHSSLLLLHVHAAGRCAIRKWLQSDDALKTLFARCQPSDRAKALGLAVFQIEGSLLNREWISTGSAELKRDAEAAELSAVGFSTCDAAMLLHTVRARMPFLDSIREQVRFERTAS